MARAARLLGVHPNTVRAWTDAGRLPCLRINARGDRRYRVVDLNAFLAAARGEPAAGARHGAAPRRQDGARRQRAARPAGSRAAEADLEALAAIARVTAAGLDLDETLREVVELLRRSFEYRLVVVAELRGNRLVPRVAAGADVAQLATLRVGSGVPSRALREKRPVHVANSGRERTFLPAPGRLLAEIAVPITAPGADWGVLSVDDARRGHLGQADVDLLAGVADQLAATIANARLSKRLELQRQHAEALRRIGAELSGNLDVSVILAELVDEAMALFEADRGAVFERLDDGTFEVRVVRGLSPEFVSFVRRVGTPSIAGEAFEKRRPVFATGFARDPRAAAARAAVRREGFDSLAIAPLLRGDTIAGALSLFHDRPRPWSEDELATLEALAAQASMAMQTARTYARMATWTAQLQSIQALGTRLSRLTSVRDIGNAIAAELRELIAYHNVRVYRVYGDDVRPVAWRGEIGEYTEEEEEQLALKVGEGITGWVAEHGEAQYLPDAARDPRAQTIPGTEDDLPESLLVCPMRFEDRVIGVIVLAKLGLHQFSPDDLRLLEIYASFAAQAMSNADATEQLHAQSEALARQLRSQRELLGITESILSTLEPQAVLEEIADRLGAIVQVDNLGIDVHDREAGKLRPLIARGTHADLYLSRVLDDELGVAGWVIRHDEGQLVNDMLADPRVAHFDETGTLAGALIVVPMRDRSGVSGVLTVERLGEGASFSTDEFELVKLYAAQASIALANAHAHHAVELRAQTDALTGLSNQGTFGDRLSRAVARGEPFSLLMIDLDDFKGYNDSFGHAAGNALLQRIARGLQTARREGDTVFRYGGDEFAILLPGTDTAGALAVATRVRSAIHAASRTSVRRRVVGCSIGAASYPVDATDADGLSLAADRALYVAKRSGRGRTAAAAEGLALAAEFLPPGPTPVDEPEPNSARLLAS